ncbi:MAG: ThuA domain-containing protein [Balneolaceae bacterium]
MNTHVFAKFLLISFFALYAPVYGSTSTDMDEPVRVLILDGVSNHNWELNTALIRGILEPEGLFDITVSTSPTRSDTTGWDAWRPDFSAYDVVIQTYNDINGGPSWPEEVKEDFEEYVRGGGGVFIYHSANNAFSDWDAYNHIIGLGWRRVDQGDALTVTEEGEVIRIPSGEGRGTGHGPRVDAMITRLGNHPIHEGLPRQWMTPDIEVYYYARGPAENVEVLSYTYDLQSEMYWPIEWTTTYGAGRVYTASYGHVWHDDTQPERMRCAGVQTLLVRAVRWLAGDEGEYPVPEDFPTDDSFSIRPEIPLPENEAW